MYKCLTTNGTKDKKGTRRNVQMCKYANVQMSFLNVLNAPAESRHQRVS